MGLETMVQVWESRCCQGVVNANAVVFELRGSWNGWFIAWVVDWRIGLAIIVVFALTYCLSRIVSLGSVLAAVTFGVCFLLWHRDNAFVMGCGLVMAALTLFMHRQNIHRLVKGQEPKTNLFGKGTKK